CEADLMRRVLPPEEFPGWLTGFLPGLAGGVPFGPAEVRDATDGRQVHLHGLNLSRAWQFRTLAAALPPADDRVARLRPAPRPAPVSRACGRAAPSIARRACRT